MSASNNTVLEGVFAINKPPGITSAQVIRDVQSHFTPSKTFAPWIRAEQARKDAESHNQKRKRTSWKQRQPLQIKIGHGGTLDPMATGVLILGVGNGTKSLSTFLECTKSYETVVLFGASTDTYDTAGKVVARKPYEHITRPKVEQALEAFKGNIMQRPPIFSALKVQGKKLYEYAREGKEVPIEIKERPVTVESLEMVEWYEGGAHKWHWPEENILESTAHSNSNSGDAQDKNNHRQSTAGAKRKLDDETIDGAASLPGPPELKRTKPSSSSEPITSGMLQDSGPDEIDTPAAALATVSRADRAPCPAPACRLCMTATSGFYVRSLSHDLGVALGSLGIMASLVRTRQADFELGSNVLWYDDLAKGEEVWGPKITEALEEWQAKEGERTAGNVKTESRDPQRREQEVDGDDRPDVEASKRRTKTVAMRREARRNTSSEED